MNTIAYYIEYHPQLIEEAVLRAIERHPKERQFRIERERVYESQEDEAREEAFQELHQRWFECLTLNSPLQEVFSYWPILRQATYKCLLMKARSRKEAGVELYVAPKVTGVPERKRRTIVIQLTAELFCYSQQLLNFLRHELLHIVDMLDPKFGYDPNFPKSQINPAYDRLLQERYRILWDITIDGRLCRNGWLPESTKAAHWDIFKNTYLGPVKDLEIVFAFFFNNEMHTHQELLSFAQSPESWFVNAHSASTSNGRCSLCHFPSFQLIIASTHLSTIVINEIQRDRPNWNPTQPICRQCADLYEARLY